MSQEGKVSVVVQSRRVPVRTVMYSRPIYSPTGLIFGNQTQHAVVYDMAFDESHARAIKEAKRLSCDLDLDFEVIDRSKFSPLRRFLSRIAGGPQPQPSLVLAPNSSVGSR
jgi:hypothetical protein